ncbi:MAG: AAA family ATPase [Wenzhouxiangellaceae bacterium]
MRIIAIANQKGGVGKTTTSINLGAGLARMGYKVLLIDLDPQGNTTVGLGVDSQEQERTACEVLLGECRLAEAIVPVTEKYLSLVPSNIDLTAADVHLMQRIGREGILRQALQEINSDYEFVLIDCPPSLNLLTVNALTAANGVLIPIQCEYFALEGLTALLDTVEQIRSTVNPKLEVEGLIRTMFDIRNNLSTEVSRQLIEHFGDKVYRTVVPRNVRVAEAPSHGQSVIDYDPESRGAIAYLGLAGEFMRRHDQQQRGVHGNA